MEADRIGQFAAGHRLLEDGHLVAAAVGEEERARVAVLGDGLVDGPVDVHVVGVLVGVVGEVLHEAVDVDIANAKDVGVLPPPPHLVVRRAGESGHVGVATGIDDRLRQDGLAARLAVDDDAPQHVALDQGVGDKRVEQAGDAGILQQLDEGELGALDIVDDVALVGVPLGADAARLGQAVGDLDGVARDAEAVVGRVEAVEHRAAHARRRDAAWEAVALDQHRPRPGPCRRQRRRHAAESAACHQHVDLVAHRHPAGRHVHRSPFAGITRHVALLRSDGRSQDRAKSVSGQEPKRAGSQTDHGPPSTGGRLARACSAGIQGGVKPPHST